MQNVISSVKQYQTYGFPFSHAEFPEGRTLNLKEYGKRAFVSKRITTTGKATANYT